MKTFALAILATAAVASDYRRYSYDNDGYSPSAATRFGTSPYRSSYQRGFVRQHYGNSRYGEIQEQDEQNTDEVAEQHASSAVPYYTSHLKPYPYNHKTIPDPATYYNYGQQTQQQQSYTGHETHEVTEEETQTLPNPWEQPATPIIDKSGWYSQYEQYSPPKIAYRPTANYPVFAICQLDSGDVQLAQLPDRTMAIQATGLTGLTASTTYEIRINEYGKTRDDEGMECQGVGTEFNPLKEVNKYGVANPYQDPSRGRISDITTDENGDVTFFESNILQNLTGKEGVLGRSLTISSKVDEVITLVDCCTIGYDITPLKYQQPEYIDIQCNQYNNYCHY